VFPDPAGAQYRKLNLAEQSQPKQEIKDQRQNPPLIPARG
jgi:hypothetical protein